MKFPGNHKHLAALLALTLGLFGAACQKQKASNSANKTNKANVAGVAADTSVQAQTPTEAYKLLYENVKAKQTAVVKGLMSEKTLDLAQMQSQQQNKSIDSVFDNGFTATTFSPTMPEIRDERVKGTMGAIEVYNSRDSRWEDLPLVKEKGGWKFAFGDIFAGTYESPGKSMSQIEGEAANKTGNNMVPLSPNINGKFGADKMKANSATATNSK